MNDRMDRDMMFEARNSDYPKRNSQPVSGIASMVYMVSVHGNNLPFSSEDRAYRAAINYLRTSCRSWWRDEGGVAAEIQFEAEVAKGNYFAAVRAWNSFQILHGGKIIDCVVISPVSVDSNF